MKQKILAFGEIIWDMYPDRQVIGGAPLNFMAHVCRNGGQGALISAVGRDDLGDRAWQSLQHFGICTEYVQRREEPTGQCLVTLDDHGIPAYRVVRNAAYDHIRMDETIMRRIRQDGYDALCFGTLIQRCGDSRRSLRMLVETCPFREIVCDVNLRKDGYDRDSVRFCLSHATILKVSREEEPELAGFGLYTRADRREKSIAEGIVRSFPGIRLVILTMGGDGSYVYEAAHGTEHRCPAVKGKVVSTVGAGDSYTAAFLTNYLSGQSIDACMKRASEISGFVVSRTEAVPDDGF